MKRSLLWITEEPQASKRVPITTDLLLESAIFSCCKREKETRTFLQILTNAPQNSQNSVYRSEILKDFQNYPLLLDRLSSCFTALDALPEQFQTERSLTKASAHFGTDARYQTSLKQLILSSSTLLNLFDHLSELLRILTKHPLESTGFLKMIERLSGLFESETFTELCKTLETLLRMPEDYLIESEFSLGESGRLCAYDIYSIETHLLELARPKGWRRFLQSADERRRAESEKRYRKVDGIPVAFSTTQFRNQMLGGIYDKSTEILNQMILSLFDEFCSMGPELQFYQVGLSILNFYEGRQIPFVYATFSEEGNTRIENLQDFVLMANSDDSHPVIPNDVSLSTKRPGILISGENNSGKTVFLRSLATALLFVQNGLPLPATSAVVTPCHAVYTLFASSENAATLGLGAGRFEEEVRTLSDQIDHLVTGDILFLNEIFQTTSYAEGAKGLFHILRFLSERGIRWVCVSHLTNLFDLFDESEVVMLETTLPTSDTPYKLLPRKK